LELFTHRPILAQKGAWRTETALRLASHRGKGAKGLSLAAMK